MSVQTRVRKLNDLLRQELGEPIYAWQWSEDLTHPMRAIHEDGSLKFDYRCGCGLNRTVHDPSCRTITVAEPVYVLRKLRLDLDHQWVLCRLLPNPPEYQWRKMFGSSLEYRPAEWAPCDPVYLDRNETPTEEVTWLVIRKMREHRSKTTADFNNAAEAAAAKREKDTYNTILDDVKDSGTAFGGVPGEKQHFSFGGIKDTPMVVNP